MTTNEIIQTVQDAKGRVRVSMSSAGTLLVVGDVRHAITMDQACGLWEWMHSASWPRAAAEPCRNMGGGWPCQDCGGYHQGPMPQVSK